MFRDRRGACVNVLVARSWKMSLSANQNEPLLMDDMQDMMDNNRGVNLKRRRHSVRMLCVLVLVEYSNTSRILPANIE